MNTIRLLLVDDEEDFRIPLAALLTNHGMEVMQAGDPKQMDNVLHRFTPDVVLLDVDLPGENGFDIASRLKQQHNFSIIMLTAYSNVEDRIEGLNRGADYYLPKPVDTRELLVVIRNLYQRNQPSPSVEPRWILNTDKWTLTTPDQKTHELAKAELQVLSVLAQHKGEPVSRREFYVALGMPDYAPQSRSLDILISRLRRRFTSEDYRIPIKTVHSVGYVFNESISAVTD
jgi:DNA-binding response OmpR family regulator